MARIAFLATPPRFQIVNNVFINNELAVRYSL